MYVVSCSISDLGRTLGKKVSNSFCNAFLSVRYIELLMVYSHVKTQQPLILGQEYDFFTIVSFDFVSSTFCVLGIRFCLKC